MRRNCMWLCIFSAVAVGCGGAPDSSDDENIGTQSEELRGGHRHRDRGEAETYTASGTIDHSNPFFLDLGTNGRTCESCHAAETAWTITPQSAKKLFRDTDGTAPLFRPNDGTVRPDADVSTVEAREAAYAMLLKKGVIRFTRSVTVATREYDVVAVDDPYGWSTTTSFSNFRRIPSVANGSHESSITWTGLPPVLDRFRALMNGATTGHAQRPTPVPLAQQTAGGDFQMTLNFAQIVDPKAGRLDESGALGGAFNLAQQPFYAGMNGLRGDSQTGAPFNREAFTLFKAWEKYEHRNGKKNRDARDVPEDVAKHRAKIARGQAAFNTLEFDITGVPGLNDDLGQATIRGTCTTCHNTPNAGSHSEFRLLNTGVADGSRRSPDVPLVTVQSRATGELIQTTDLGRGQSTGKIADIGKVRVPILRGVGQRPPYFHDGSARNLNAVLDFYEQRFGVCFGDKRDDIIAFLKAL